jgi:uncharacterized protein YneF (UPF0154 family)
MKEIRIKGFFWTGAIVLLLLCFFFTMVGIFMTADYIHRKFSDPPRIAPKGIKTIMKYHGIEVLYEDWDGKHYFYNERGQKCRVGL